MKISKNRIKQIIKEELTRVNEQGSWSMTGPPRDEVLSPEHIMILKSAGYDVSTINPGNMNDDMRSAIAHVTGGGDIADWLPPGDESSEGASWTNGQKISQLISMLERIKSEHGDIPVEAFEADGASIEGSASVVLDVKEPDSENTEFISETTLAIMVD